MVSNFSGTAHHLIFLGFGQILDNIYTNTCQLRAKGEGEKGQEKNFNPSPFTFSPS
ncbi:hypothetical protein FDUTEX481_07677 [Tolypothrix sp. PCC 7601]|nr:hypothetical protein FDUTEX481_07677 [Tolypothrix sp. PCC 7601]